MNACTWGDNSCDAGTSSFGMSGVNAHMVLSSPSSCSQSLHSCAALLWKRQCFWPAPKLHRLAHPAAPHPPGTFRCWACTQAIACSLDSLRSPQLEAPLLEHQQPTLLLAVVALTASQAIYLLRSCSCAVPACILIASGRRLMAPSMLRCLASLGSPALAFLQDHRVQGRVLAAGAAFLEAALGAAAMATEDSMAGLLGLGGCAFVGAMILPSVAHRYVPESERWTAASMLVCWLC